VVEVEPDPRTLDAAFATIAPRPGGRPFVLGISGAQGSGKSTLARAISRRAAASGLAAATLSLDDLYLTRREREALAREVHPLLLTRGVPGTHDVELGLSVFDSLDRGEPAALPRFDKARDDRVPSNLWPRAPDDCALVIFEGWCLGARPQTAEALRAPVNVLEAREDTDGAWRTYANSMLAGPYQRLFARIDALVLLAAPSFEVVLGWRQQQEAELRAHAGPGARGVMDDRAVARFVQHYERLTRHILAEMTSRADLLVQLDENRAPLAISRSAASSR
jgi:D-glycerate 3-kinase